MIISKLNGGIGNQLFQYAIGKSLAVQKKTILKLDVSYFSWDVNSELQRKFLLNKYNIDCEIASRDEIEKILYAKNIHRFISRKIMANKIPYYKENLVIEKDMYYDENIFKTRKNVILEGYWPNERYFANVKEVLHKELRLKEENISTSFKNSFRKITSTESVSVHVRRSDYINTNNGSFDIFGVCDKKYYEKAVSYIKDNIKTPILYIFTDDIDWVKNSFHFDADSVIVSNNNLMDFEELQLMSYCKHNIIANSTFGWWGAWLNENAGKIIIAPEKWYNDKNYQLFYEKSDFVPLSWIRI